MSIFHFPFQTSPRVSLEWNLESDIDPQFSGELDSVLLQVGHFSAHSRNLLVYIGKGVMFPIEKGADSPICMTGLIA